jgi:hypothetical protein
LAAVLYDIGEFCTYLKFCAEGVVGGDIGAHAYWGNDLQCDMGAFTALKPGAFTALKPSTLGTACRTAI